MNYHFDFSGVLYNLPAYGRAVLVTLQLTVFACVAGTLAGLPVAGCMLIPGRVGQIGVFIIEAFRSVPDLVLFFFFYYFPYHEMFGILPPSPFACAFLAMSTVLAAFAGVLFRDAIRQAPRTHILGLRGLGLADSQIFRYAVMPAVVRQTLPALIAFWIGILKMSSLSSVIGVSEVTFVARTGMAQNYRSLEAWIAVALIYALLVTPSAYALKLLQRRPWMQRQ